MPVTEKTGAQHPSATFLIWALQIVMRSGSTPTGEFEVRGYVDDSAIMQGFEPFEESGPIAFTEEDLASLQAQFTVAVLGLLLKRDRFKSAIIVT